MRILSTAVRQKSGEQRRRFLSARPPLRNNRPTPAPGKTPDKSAPPYELLDRPLDIDDWRPLHGPAPTD